MIMQRKCIADFNEWLKRGSGRKPLLIRGARQIGKTTAVRLFAKQAGLELVECNMEKEWNFTSLLSSKNPQKIIEAIEFELNCDILPNKTVLFFDEVQAAPEIIPLLRYFYEEAQEYIVVATGSLLEFTLAEPAFSFPVGRVELYYMNCFSFEEFLEATGENKAVSFIRNYDLNMEIPDSVHSKLQDLVKMYTITGGMPEAVNIYKETQSLREVERVKATIVETFILDFNKYLPKSKPDVLRKVFDGIPLCVGRKLIYSKIADSFRSNDVSKAVEQLKYARLLTRVFHSSGNGIPLAAERNERFFKIVMLDVGLLLTQLKLNVTDIHTATDFNMINNGVLAEQFIGQQLLSIQPYYQEPDLFYWAREKKNSSAEVDYLITDSKNRIVPVEVKSGKTGSLRSLQTIIAEKKYGVAVRFNSDKVSILSEKRVTPKGEVDFKLVSLPHYLVQQVDRIISQI